MNCTKKIHVEIFASFVEFKDEEYINKTIKSSIKHYKQDLASWISYLLYFCGYQEEYKWLIKRHFSTYRTLWEWIKSDNPYSEGMKQYINEHNYPYRLLNNISTNLGRNGNEKSRIIHNYVIAFNIYAKRKQIKNKFPFPKDIVKIICKMIVQ